MLAQNTPFWLQKHHFATNLLLKWNLLGPILLSRIILIPGLRLNSTGSHGLSIASTATIFGIEWEGQALSCNTKYCCCRSKTVVTRRSIWLDGDQYGTYSICRPWKPWLNFAWPNICVKYTSENVLIFWPVMAVMVVKRVNGNDDANYTDIHKLKLHTCGQFY